MGQGQKNRRDAAPELPIEVILQVLGLTMHRRHLWEREPNSTLAKCALVCKTWLIAARLELYSALYLYRYEARSSGRMYSRLKRTLREHPDLAAITRTIYFAAYDYSREDDTKNVGEVISLCKNLTRIDVFGWPDKGDLQIRVLQLRAKIARVEKLEHLTLYALTMDDMQCMPYCHPCELFEMMAGWTCLRTLLVHRDVISPSNEDFWARPEDAEEGENAIGLRCTFPVSDGACSALERVTWSSIIRDQTVVALARTAPHLRVLHLANASMVNARTLKPALNVWSETLEYLAVEVGKGYPHDQGDERTRPFALDDALPRLPHLKVLKTCTLVVQSRCFQDGFPELEYLALGNLVDGDVLILSAAVSSALPSLRSVLLRDEYNRAAPASQFGEGCHQGFLDVCSARGVLVKGGEKGTVGWTLADEFAYEMDLPDELARELVMSGIEES